MDYKISWEGDDANGDQVGGDFETENTGSSTKMQKFA